MCIGVCLCVWSVWGCQNPCKRIYKQLWAIMWLLEIDPRSSGRAVSDLNHWVFSPALQWNDFLKHSVAVVFMFLLKQKSEKYGSQTWNDWLPICINCLPSHCPGRYLGSHRTIYLSLLLFFPVTYKSLSSLPPTLLSQRHIRPHSTEDCKVISCLRVNSCEPIIQRKWQSFFFFLKKTKWVSYCL